MHQQQNTDSKQKYLQVALNVAIDSLFEYSVTIEQNITIGARVLVPFGSYNKLKVGIVIEVNCSPLYDANKIKPIVKVLDAKTLVTPFLINTIKWSANYYYGVFNSLLLKCLPNAFKQNKPLPNKKTTVWQAYPNEKLTRKSLQLKLLEQLQQEKSGLTTEQIQQNGFNKSTIVALANKKLIFQQQVPISIKKFYTIVNKYNPTKHFLSTEQNIVVQDVTANLGSFKAFLLDGITGSGKTEVYLQAMQHAIDANKQVLVMIPEIALVPQTLTRIQQRFNINVVCYHSGLTDNQRYNAWLQCHNESAGILVATRSGVFAPLPKLGLIIIDEEHDASYKNQQGTPYYNARDVAILIASWVKCPIILGSATPSLESYHNVARGKYQLYKLTKRVNIANLPNYEIIDVCGRALQSGIADVTLAKITEHLHRNEQVIILLNRRGYANSLICHSCGKIVDCPHCDASMILHKVPPHIKCHHCELTSTLPKCCSNCKNKLQLIGYGTEKTEELLQHIFKNYEVIRIDRDSITKKNNMQHLANKLAKKYPCIIVGTQMLAKGHHWPYVTLVVILNIDSGIFSEDFRGIERTAQLITQAAGRSGREQPGQVIVQTYHPKNRIFDILKGQSYYDYVQYMLQDRSNKNLPPYTNMAIIRAEDKNNDKIIKFLLMIQDFFKNMSSAKKLQLAIFGPLESKLFRKNNYYRWFFIIKGNRTSLHLALQEITNFIKTQKNINVAQFIIDIDPYEVI